MSIKCVYKTYVEMKLAALNKMDYEKHYFTNVAAGKSPSNKSLAIITCRY